MVESICCSAAELEGIAALIDGVLSRENIAVDAVLSSLMSRDSETHEHCVKAEDLAKYPSFAHIGAERLLQAPCQTLKRNLAFYPALREPRRTLIFRCVAEEDKTKILTLLQKCPLLGEAASEANSPSKISPEAAEAEVEEKPAFATSAKLVQNDADGSPISTADGGEDYDEEKSSVADQPKQPAPALDQKILGVKFETSAFAPSCYVTLATEDLTKEVALWLVSQELEPGRPVRVGIKSEAEWAFASPPPPMSLQRRKPVNYNRNKRKIGPRRPITRGQGMQHYQSSGTSVAPANAAVAPTSVLSALDQFPPLDATLSEQLTIRYSPKELRVIRDAVLESKASPEVHAG